ncbi:FHA domain-containing protein [Thermosporothrix hazakensis]|uniref:FHA domain-containing protein n=1 Tax=Thermosporothrix hazakensis TaxID=644383 RepID=A0A326UVN3_THEHA|nr:FHA domain-containing protein [Thermosporothrix hazakensis]PZW36553.1 FHA domain-containing protein [Thermosporothrix hazakensis]
MDKCPFCGADTRPEDNFCLNCGNRLHGTPAVPQQSIPAGAGEPTLANQDEWSPSGQEAGTVPARGWSDPMAPTVSGNSEQEPAYQAAPVANATMEKIEEPARFILRSEDGHDIQEYVLDKAEITIGRAPNSDILLSKDKLTSRRHALVTFENGQYFLRDEHSANGTFVNGQQLEENAVHQLRENDHIGIGEHELIFRAPGSVADDVADFPTVSVDESSIDHTYRTNADANATIPTTEDAEEYATFSMSDPEANALHGSSSDSYSFTDQEGMVPATEEPAVPVEDIPTIQEEEPEKPVYTPQVEKTQKTSSPELDLVPPTPILNNDPNVTFGRLTSISQPELPDLSSVIAALSSLDGQVKELQDQFVATQDAMRKHESDVASVANQLRSGIRRVSERMDNTIADVARSREALAWAELSQLMEDVMNNPRDIEYVTKLARKARELNKVFQIHQAVLNTMAECNSLLRKMIGDESQG